MGIQVYGNGCSTSIHDRDVEGLRKRAYKEVYIENADIPKINKIIDGINKGSINKSNLYDEVRRMTQRVTSDHSIKRWQIIAEWFDETTWFL